MARAFSAQVEHRLHQAFELSLLAKALFALTELVSGLAVWLIPTQWVMDLATTLTRQELAEDPTDRLAHWLLHQAQQFSMGAQHFWALYLVTHATVKLVLVFGLVKRWLWAYPASIVVLFLFIAYQIDRFAVSHDPVMIGLTLFDLIVIWLIRQEWRRMTAARG
ncbi:MAG: DUF2127 domain-containing protein [Paracoccaceae bacterium]|nr:DUF2127 domain-containing protein [Paracoccaceae bacterium]